jgi:dihydrofolate reductase
MKKIILYITASLDQRIAYPDGGFEWLTERLRSQKQDYGYNELLDSVSAIMMGGRTYHEMLNMDLKWSSAGKHTYVISRNEWNKHENVSFISENIIEAISEIRNRESGDIMLIGGSELISILLAGDLIDEMNIVYFPLILGKGIPLFSEQCKESTWELTAKKSYENGVLSVRYQKKHETQ